ncbi:hypothetical protein CVT26_014321 [Gymnopilus dilepis]|uniref:Uncharacterized protein n=1 Tax=Gymnopilus dilepis TaxID=231916 RepID=A0A409WTP5_9AGAR|nr:hypothetical protein CVT26_014321 [Gymnopilus dilepis]
MPLTKNQVPPSNSFPQCKGDYPRKLEVRGGDGYFTSPNTSLPPPEVCPPVTCSSKLSPSDLRHRRWSLDCHPYLAFIPTSAFTSNLKLWFLTPAKEVRLVQGSYGWHLPTEVAKKWKEFEQTTRKVAQFLDACILKKHPQFCGLWTAPEKPGSFGYFEAHKSESEARQSLVKSLDAFIIHIAYMAFLNCLLSADPLCSNSRKSIDDIITAYSSERLSLNLHPAWIQTCLPPLIDLQSSRVGCVIDVSSCTWIGLVPYLVEVDIPVWLYWGSPPFKPIDRYIIPWATSLIPSCRTVAKPVIESQQAASRPFPRVEEGSGQRPGETMRAYFERRKKHNAQVRAKEKPTQRRKRLGKAKQQAGKPAPGHRGPTVYKWEMVDGVRIRQVLTRGQVDESWGHIPKRKKFYDPYSNQYDCCSEWSFDPDDHDDDLPAPNPIPWDPDDSDEDFDLHEELRKQLPHKPSSSRKNVTPERCVVDDVGASSTSNLLAPHPESHHVDDTGTSSTSNNLSAEAKSHHIIEAGTPASVPSGLPGDSERVDVSATTQLLTEGQEDQEMVDNSKVDELVTSMLVDRHSDAGVVYSESPTTEPLQEDQEMVDDQNVGGPLTSLPSMVLLPTLRWASTGGFVMVGDAGTARALEGPLEAASSPMAFPASQSGQNSSTASCPEGLEAEDIPDLYAASMQAVLDMTPIATSVISLPDQDTFSDLIYSRFGYILDEFPYTGLPPSFGAPTHVYQNWQTVLYTVGGKGLLDSEKPQPAFADFLYVLTTAEDVFRDMPSKFWDLSSENHHALERIDTDALHFLIEICRTRKNGGTWCLLHPKESPAGSWFVGLAPSSALECIRRGLGPSDIDVVDFLIDHGISFRTFTRLPGIPRTPHFQHSRNPDRPILGFRQKGYIFDLADYAAYEALRDRILTLSPQGRRALSYGGIIARLARDVLPNSSIYSGPSSSALDGSETLFEDNVGVFVDDALSDSMLDLITGTYRVYTNKGNQTEVVSWFPRVNVWAAAGLNVGYWTRDCKQWFAGRRDEILSQGASPLNATTWRKALRMNRKGPEVLFTTESAALAYLESSPGHVLRL